MDFAAVQLMSNQLTLVFELLNSSVAKQECWKFHAVLHAILQLQ